MYGWEPHVLLRHYLEPGLTITAIAERLRCNRRPLQRWVAAGVLDRDPTHVRYGPRPSVPTQLDPYQPLIRERLETYPELTAVRLFEEVRAAGCPGSLTQLKVFVRRVRPRPEPESVVRFETPPGHQGQIDFAEVRLPWGKRHVLLVVLGYSRLLWLQFYPRQTMRTLMGGLEAAFAYFGGVPRELLFDQLKAVILDDQRPQGGRVLENPEFLRFAAHWGFRIRACRPYRAQTKGKVERPIRYVRQSFLYGRAFAGDADLNAQALRRLVAAMRSSRLPAVKTLGDFDFTFQPSLKREQIDSLHTLGFVERRENVILLGPPGVGKTHLAISLAIAAAQSGRRVYYGTLADLITSLEEASQAGHLSQRLKTLVFPSLLVVDEIGYLPISRTGAMLFFQLMSRRYERASTVLTSNKSFDEWGEVFGDDVMASALIDRLVHHCHIVNIRGNSYRMRQHADLQRLLSPTPSPPPHPRRRSRQEAPAS
jgi:DNA replication protein DnaC